jgi:lipid II:glycine glycyltransferase (peptidoglycan interpeptide bridge formation enzyme)
MMNQCTDKSKWDEFVKKSPQGSIFCRTAFLDALAVDYDIWFLEDKGQPQIGTVILRKGDEILPAPHGFTMYQGPIFSEYINSQLIHTRTSMILKYTEELLSYLSQQYYRFSFCLHHAHPDLRGIQWFNYHEPKKGQFKFVLRYTGLLDLNQFNDFEDYLLSIRTTRRYEYRKALRDGMQVESSTDIDTLEHLHGLTYERTGLEQTEDIKGRLRRITRAALDGKFGDYLICRNPSGEVVSATLFLNDENCAYFLIGANHPAYRNTSGGTLLMVENIIAAKKRGLRWVDMVGINSPYRGDFKVSFNAATVPYFVVTWEHPKF